MMEKTLKPVPDVKALHYHSTAEKPNIKIFVSHRIDMDSACVKNPLYYHMRCGAALDNRQGVSIAGDNTGENISLKKKSYCEFTVQYWAWKNYDADYYGLCHYRRYLSFADSFFPTTQIQNFAVEPQMSYDAIKKHCLNNPRKMRREIMSHDVIVSPYYEIKGQPINPQACTERELWERQPRLLICNKDIDILFEIIKELFPQYYETALEVLEMDVHRGFNCFIMRRELFYEMCEFEFGVLAEFEKRVNICDRVGSNERTIGYLGEILYGTYLRWLEKSGKYKIKVKQIVFFQETSVKLESTGQVLFRKAKAVLKNLLPACRIGLRNELAIAGLGAHIETLGQQIRILDEQVREMSVKLDQIQKKENFQFWLSAPIIQQDQDEVKHRFWDSYPSATGDLRTIQRGNALLLKCFQYYCDQANVRFWLHGGSLVGSLRHHGFVPWDDDIDIAMMRDDFLSLLQVLRGNAYFKVKEYYYAGLGCRSYRFRTAEESNPFFVDIFVYDNYDRKFDDTLTDWNMLTSFKRGLIAEFLSYTGVFGFRPEDAPLDERPEYKEKIDALIDSYITRTASQNHNSEYLLWGMDNNYENETCYAWHHGRIFAREDIYPLIEVPFEGMICYAPANYEKYSHAEYGIGYLEMPNSFGSPVHTMYFSGIDISQKYEDLVDIINKSSITI